jgi:SAM-dependent methyltransferase
MLAEARRRKEALELGIEFRQQDMRSLDVEGRPFDAVISLFDSIGYVQTNEALLAVLKGAHDHLRSGGLIVLEYWHAAAMLRHYDPVRLRRWRAPEGEVIRISETKLDHARQVAEVTYTVIERRDNGTMRELKETQANRYFLTQEMAGWLERSGFTPLRSFAGFDWERPIDGDTWHIVTVARKSG